MNHSGCALTYESLLHTKTLLHADTDVQLVMSAFWIGVGNDNKELWYVSWYPGIPTTSVKLQMVD